MYVVAVFSLATANVRLTSAAGLKFALPVCDAVIVHEPAPVTCTVDPATVQLPAAANVTGSPDDAVALTVKSASPKVLSGRAANVIVWFASEIENERTTSGAGL